MARQFLCWGRACENNVTQVGIDCSAWLTTYPSATFVLCVQLPNHDSIYTPTGVSTSTGVITWTVSAFDVSVAGEGHLEVRMYSGEVIKKSATCSTKIVASMNGPEVSPSTDIASWIDSAICPNLTSIIINKPSGSLAGAPWDASNATVTWTG